MYEENENQKKDKGKTENEQCKIQSKVHSIGQRASSDIDKNYDQ